MNLTEKVIKNRTAKLCKPVILCMPDVECSRSTWNSSVSIQIMSPACCCYDPKVGPAAVATVEITLAAVVLAAAPALASVGALEAVSG